MLEDNELLFNKAGNRKHVFRNINKSLQSLFNGKTVFFLPGRSGQTANFLRRLGADVGLTTDSRYLPPALSVLNSNKLGNDFSSLHNTHRIAFLIDAKFEQISATLNSVREGIDDPLKSNGKILYVDRSKLEPNMIISTNMFNTDRFGGGVGESCVHHDKIKLLLQLASIGIPNKTIIYLVPATEHGSALTKSEIIETLTKYADLRFYDPERSGGESILPTLADFAVSISLKEKIPEYLL